eukprot:1222863-Rhodomonas_salina.2
MSGGRRKAREGWSRGGGKTRARREGGGAGGLRKGRTDEGGKGVETRVLDLTSRRWCTGQHTCSSTTRYLSTAQRIANAHAGRTKHDLSLERWGRQLVGQLTRKRCLAPLAVSSITVAW